MTQKVVYVSHPASQDEYAIVISVRVLPVRGTLTCGRDTGHLCNGNSLANGASPLRVTRLGIGRDFELLPTVVVSEYGCHRGAT